VSVVLGRNGYGKSGVRMVKVARHGDRHDIKDLTVAIQFEGPFEKVHTEGDNSTVLPTDTMKNTVYAIAKRYSWEQAEEFGIILADHFFADNPHVSTIRIDIEEHRWERLAIGGKAHRTAFSRAGKEIRTATVIRNAGGARTVEGGVDGLIIIKTAQSGFEGYMRDRYTTLKETRDRLLATSMTARWRYSGKGIAYGASWEAVRKVLLEAFAEHDSRSVQHTLYAMAESVIDNVPDVEEISLSLPNRHHLLVDLRPFGLENDNEIFVATEEPYGLIEATVRRGE
jgi:urate oxidase